MVSPHDKLIMSLRPADSDPRDAGGNGEPPEGRAMASSGPRHGERAGKLDRRLDVQAARLAHIFTLDTRPYTGGNGPQ